MNLREKLEKLAIDLRRLQKNDAVHYVAQEAYGAVALSLESLLAVRDGEAEVRERERAAFVAGATWGDTRHHFWVTAELEAEALRRYGGEA